MSGKVGNGRQFPKESKRQGCDTKNSTLSTTKESPKRLTAPLTAAALFMKEIRVTPKPAIWPVSPLFDAVTPINSHYIVPRRHLRPAESQGGATSPVLLWLALPTIRFERTRGGVGSDPTAMLICDGLEGWSVIVQSWKQFVFVNIVTDPVLCELGDVELD